jgi:hypothetical protein
MSGILVIFAAKASAGPWSIEPRLGVSTIYDTNPGFQTHDPNSETHVAALFNLPVRYDGDGVVFGITPSGRISDSQGYSSLSSSYAQLDANAQFTGELNSATITGDLARDSSLYHAGELVNGVGVRRDTVAAAGDWTHLMTERSQFQVDSNWSRVRYDQPPNATSLVDYRYWSAGPTFAFALNERNTLKLFGTYGDYQSLDGMTQSISENVQVGFVRQMRELWSLSASAGYSHSANSAKYFYGPYYLGSQEFSQDGSVFSVSLTHAGEKLTLTAAVSQALQPTGFAYLSHQQSVNVSAGYVSSERWDFKAETVWQNVKEPRASATDINVHYRYAQVTANWHWTAQWIISLHASRVLQRYEPPPTSAASSAVSLDIIRQFLRTDL